MDSLIKSIVSNEVVDSIILVTVGMFRLFLTGQVFERLGCSPELNYTKEFILSACDIADGNIYCNATDAEAPEYFCRIIQAIDPRSQVINAVKHVLLVAAGFWINIVREYVETSLRHTIDWAFDSLYPAQIYMVTIPLSFGGLVALLTSIRYILQFHFCRR